LTPWAASAFVGNVTCQQNFLVPLLSQEDMVGTLQSFSQDHSHERIATFMSVEENIQLMRRWFQEVWNEGRIQSIHDLLASNAIGIGQLEDGSELRGPAAFVPFVERIRGAFPDTNIKVEDAFGASDKGCIALVGYDDAPRQSSWDSRHRQTCESHGDDHRSHSRQKDYRGMGQLGSAGNAEADRSLRESSSHIIEKCIVYATR
jgi:SnoaL-like polyketide cyclase